MHISRRPIHPKSFDMVILSYPLICAINFSLVSLGRKTKRLMGEAPPVNWLLSVTSLAAWRSISLACGHQSQTRVVTVACCEQRTSLQCICGYLYLNNLYLLTDFHHFKMKRVLIFVCTLFGVYHGRFPEGLTFQYENARECTCGIP